MVFVDLDNILIELGDEGSPYERKLSAPEKAIVECNRINWLLYRSKYWLGADWSGLTRKVKKDVLEGLIHHIYCDEDRNVVEMYSIVQHPYMKRANFLV